MQRLILKSQNHRAMKQREALFRRFGYDSAASLKFAIAKALPLPGHVLEIGTGKGRFLAAMAKHADRITTLDVDAKQQRAAKLHVHQTQSGRPIRFVVHDAEHLPWPDASFDTVASMNTFHHLERPMRVFEEMLRVLKPGGKLVLCDFSPHGFQIFDRIHRFEGGTHPRLKNGLADFARLVRRCGWKTKRTQGCNQELLVAIAPSAPTKENTHTHDNHRNSLSRRPASRTLWRLPGVHARASGPRATKNCQHPESDTRQ